MPSKKPISTDVFGDSKSDNGHSEWVSKCRRAQYNLEQVKNPYVGNKRKLLVDLGSVLFKEGLQNDIQNGQVLDLFSGSGFVSYFFKHLGSAVWANDILASSHMNALSLIETNHSISESARLSHSGGYLQMVTDILTAEAENIGSRIRDKYVPDRFSEEEANHLDRIMATISKPSFSSLSQNDLQMKFFGQGPLEKEYNPYAHSYVASCSIMHYILERCFVGGRLNSGQILAKFSHRIEHPRNGGNEMTFRPRDMPTYNITVEDRGVCRATRSDAIELLTTQSKHTSDALNNLSLVYIDPPYGGDQSDYSAMYEFLEFFILGDSYEEEKQKDLKRFAQSKSYKNSFRDLLAELPKQAVWVLSYNDSSWSDIEGIVDSIKQFRNKVSVHEIDYKYHYRKDNSSGTEYVIVVRPE